MTTVNTQLPMAWWRVHAPLTTGAAATYCTACRVYQSHVYENTRIYLGPMEVSGLAYPTLIEEVGLAMPYGEFLVTEPSSSVELSHFDCMWEPVMPGLLRPLFV